MLLFKNNAAQVKAISVKTWELKRISDAAIDLLCFVE